MAPPAFTRRRIIAGLILTTLVSALGLALLYSKRPLSNRWLQASYDLLHTPQGLDNSPVVIVYLDVQAYLTQKQDPGRPWPRDLHAQLVNRLTQDGARAVVFDIVFSDAGGDPAADQALAQAIEKNHRVILAAEYSEKAFHSTDDTQHRSRLHSLTPPLEKFARVAAASGIAEQRIDDDFVIRAYLAGFPDPPRPSLTWAAAKWLDLPVTSGTSAMQAANQHWIRYYGPPLSIPNVGYDQALEPTGVPPGFFRDKIVFIGARPIIGLLQAAQDQFPSPFHSFANKEPFHPGVEVHATEMLNLLRGDYLVRLTAFQELLILGFCAALFGAGLVWLRPIPATLASLAGAGAIYGLAAYGFSRGVWFPWLLQAGAQIPAALAGAVLFYSVEWFVLRKRLEAGKKAAEAKVREQAALIDKANDAILVQDLSGQILYANPSAERLYGWRLAELQADGAANELFSPEPAQVAAARAAALAQGEWNGQLRQRTRAGQLVIVESRWTLIRAEDGQAKALLLINSDVTEKKQLEAQFLRSQRLNTIGTLAGGMAHDLNNALAPILMGVQLLGRKSGDDESRQLLSLMETSTLRGADMVRQVLLFARGRGGDIDQLDLGPVVRELEKIVRETFPKTVQVESFIPADLWPVRGNLTQLHQVLLNLCVNARDAMPDGGRLSFAADNVELDATQAAAIQDGKAGSYVSMLVSDTGSGMSPEVRARLFEPFFTTKGEGRGTGMGLATVLRIVKGHGGFLRVESEPGQGTTFELFLPRAEALAAQVRAAATAPPPQGQGELLLVADDEQAIRQLLAEGFASHGYRVLTAAGGQEALDLFNAHASEIRLLVTDTAMPTLSGPQLVSRIRQVRPDLPIILASGDAETNDLTGTERVVCLSKPFSLEEILTSVHSLLHP